MTNINPTPSVQRGSLTTHYQQGMACAKMGLNPERCRPLEPQAAWLYENGYRDAMRALALRGSK